MAGRNGLHPDEDTGRRDASKLREQARKRVEADHRVRESKKTVDAFTASVERAMRGQRP